MSDKTTIEFMLLATEWLMDNDQVHDGFWRDRTTTFRDKLKKQLAEFYPETEEKK